MADSSSPPSPDPTEETDTASPGRSRRRLAFLAAVIALVLAGAGVVAALVVTDDEGDPQERDDETAEPEDDRGHGGDGEDGGGSRSDDGNAATATPDDPEAVVRAYLDAFADEDCQTMAGFVTDQSLTSEGLSREEALRSCQDGFEADQAEAFDIREVELVREDDGGAVVEVSADIEGETESTRFTLQRVDERWLIDLTATDAATGDDEEESAALADDNAG